MAMAAAARALALAACLASAAAARRPLWSWPVSSSTDWLWDLSRELPARPAFSCDPGDDPVTCASLGEFYAATNGSGWVNAKGWATAAAGASPLLSPIEGGTLVPSHRTLVDPLSYKRVSVVQAFPRPFAPGMAWGAAPPAR